ncbi:hypothetical protein [Vogesella sp. AC12]|uniref:hypothetical protein n=1 Tax=Vogesella sp. AC12 TaxID=2950550 RepID=UPI00210B8064|nr:hypothetical protein [Vogesella sp. AC12]MCQ4143217.1 hypothetical protein [Vogesella sp. AC12]
MSKPTPPVTVAEQVFRDKAFKSRTLVLKDGRAVPVENYTVTTSDKDVIAFLDSHADFARQPATADSAAE